MNEFISLLDLVILPHLQVSFMGRPNILSSTQTERCAYAYTESACMFYIQSRARIIYSFSHSFTASTALENPISETDAVVIQARPGRSSSRGPGAGTPFLPRPNLSSANKVGKGHPVGKAVLPSEQLRLTSFSNIPKHVQCQM